MSPENIDPLPKGVNEGDLLSKVIQCIDVSISSAEESADQSEILDFCEEKIREVNKGKSVLTCEHEIMMHVWNHIYSLIEDTSHGDIIREVLANDLFSIPMTWDKEEDRLNKTRDNKERL